MTGVSVGHKGNSLTAAMTGVSVGHKKATVSQQP